MTMASILIPVAALAAGVFIGSTLLHGAGEDDVVQMRKLVIVDAEGRPRIVLGSHDGGEPGVWVLDDEEHLRIGMHWEPGKDHRNALASVAIYAGDRKPLLALETGYSEQHGTFSSVGFYDRDPSDGPYMSLHSTGTFGPGLTVHDEQRSRVMSLTGGLGRRIHGPQLFMSWPLDAADPDGSRRSVYLGMNQLREQVTASLGAGDSSIDLRIDEHGEPTIEIEKDGTARTIAVD